MKQSNLKSFVTAFTFALLSLLAFNAKAGGDSYEIYLNNKLILKQFVFQQLTISRLQLDKANANDKLIIFYNHCGQTGRGRTIAIKDAKGNLVKQWNFADATRLNKGMVIPVKDLLQLEKNNSKTHLLIYYAAEQLPNGRMLSSLDLGKKEITLNAAKAALPATRGFTWADIYYLEFLKI